MMLSMQEVRGILRTFHQMTPDDFAKHVADYMPQGVLEQIMDEATEMYGDRHDPMEMAAILMVGLQMGWLLAEKAHA